MNTLYETFQGSFCPGRRNCKLKNIVEGIENYYGISGCGQFSGALGNSGELVQLSDSSGNLIDEVQYDDGGDWVSSPDGGGPSLELTNPNLDNSLPQNWQASYVINGTPGAANSSDCPIPENLVAQTVDENNVMLNWNPPTGRNLFSKTSKNSRDIGETIVNVDFVGSEIINQGYLC